MVRAGETPAAPIVGIERGHGGELAALPRAAFRRPPAARRMPQRALKPDPDRRGGKAWARLASAKAGATVPLAANR